MRVTLDHNCILSLENNDGHAEAIRTLIHLNDCQAIHLCVVGMGASELGRGRAFPGSFDEFRRRLLTIGLGSNIEVLAPMAYFDLTYWDNCVSADDSMEQLERRIHEILFHHVEFAYVAFCQSRGLDPTAVFNTAETKTWRGAKCDVQTLWAHIWYHGDIFVTSDKNFHKATKKPRLQALGAGIIALPDEATGLVSASIQKSP